MTSKKHRLLVDILIKKTEDNSLDWQKTADDDVFQLVFSTSSLRLSKMYDFDAENDDFFVDLINAEGEIVERFSDNDLDDRALPQPQSLLWYKKMQDLYDVVKRQAIGSDKVMDEILAELGRLS